MCPMSDNPSGETGADRDGPDAAVVARPESRPIVGRRAVAPYAVGLVLLSLLLYGRDMTRSRGAAGDSFHHLVNGVFVHDALLDPFKALSDPLAFYENYYAHFPAVNLGYYPPGFPMMEAVLMFLFGVSPATGQLTVLLTAVLFTLCSFFWFRLRFNTNWAAAATAVLVASPMLVHHGRDIMLEIPMMAFVMGAMWAFEKVLQTDRPRWGVCMAWAFFTAVALATKQHALMLVILFPLAVVLTGRLTKVFTLPILTATVVILAAAGALVAMTVMLGGSNVAHSVGLTKAHVVDRFNWRQWEFYLTGLPQIVGWPLLALTAIGVWQAVRLRDRSAITLGLWMVVFYAMHSFFKAQEWRYGCLWIPPFVALAVAGLRDLVTSRAEAADTPPVERGSWHGALLLAALTGYALIEGVGVVTPRVPDAYQRAAAELRDRMPPFSCLSFVPDRPGRMPVCYRLALEDRADRSAGIFGFGRIVRAGQVWNAARERWGDAPMLSKLLAEWNIKYIVLTRPAIMETFLGDPQVARKLDEVIATGDYVEIGRYALEPADARHPDRTLHLYERKSPMIFDPNAQVPIRTHRIPTSITASSRSDAP